MTENNFGERLEKAIRSNYLTHKEFAEQINTTPETVSRYVNSDKLPPATAIIKIAKALNVSTDYLLDVNIPEFKQKDFAKVNIVKPQIIAWLKENASKLPNEDVQTILGILCENNKLLNECGTELLLLYRITALLNTLNYDYKILSSNHIRCFYPDSDDYTMISICNENNIVFGGKVIGDIDDLKGHLIDLKLRG